MGFTTAKQYREEDLRIRREQEAARVKPEWGVFAWEAANMYRRASALRVYKRRADAERYCDKANGADAAANLVTRPVDPLPPA